MLQNYEIGEVQHDITDSFPIVECLYDYPKPNEKSWSNYFSLNLILLWYHISLTSKKELGQSNKQEESLCLLSNKIKLQEEKAHTFWEVV